MTGSLEVKLSLSSVSRIGRYLAAAAIWVLPLPADAQSSSHLELTWSAPAGCPTEANVQARVASLLGEAATSVADVRAVGQIARSGAAYRLQLSMSAGTLSSSRVLEAGSCDELAGAAAISLALLARSGSSEPSGTSPPVPTTDSPPAAPAEAAPREPRPETPPSSAPSEEGETPRTATRATPNALHFVLHAPLVVVGRGTLPSLGVGLGAAAGLRWRALRVLAGADLWKEQQRGQLGFESRFALQSAHVEACLTQPLGVLELGPCAGVSGERLVGEGLASGTFSSRSARSLGVSGTGGVLASLQVPAATFWRVVAQATVQVPSTRTRFVIDQLGTVHQPGVAAVKLDFGCEWIF